MPVTPHTIDKNSLATIVWSLQWQSPEARHDERYLARRVNFWRDIFPKGMFEALKGTTSGGIVAVDYAPNEALPQRLERQVLELEPRQVRSISVANRSIPLNQGRFYPRRIVLGVPGILPEDNRPCRLLKRDARHTVVDLNHPMADKACRLEATVMNCEPKRSDTGGQLFDWLETIIDWGPGMQATSNGQPTVFNEHYPLTRQDQTPDTEFYNQPRLINHVDAQASELLAETYACFLRPGMRVLDLMSSMQSHLPQDAQVMQDVSVSGLGLNREEMAANPQLTAIDVADLNQNPVLPYYDGAFDLALCSLSVEYLTDPLAVFAEVRRVLVPGGRFAVSFSDRWFPTKVAGSWPDLHPFERMGQVLQWFQETGGFHDLETVSYRNWWRPADDPYFWQIRASDPIFVVSGAKTGY